MSGTVLIGIAIVVGFYMAWNIGANDVANAMGTSVGSKALTLKQAILVAAVLEFLGAVLVGAYVTDTVRKGIVNPAVFATDPNVLVHGMIAALAAASIWLNVASLMGWPVSTTHSIVGAVAGFGIVVAGADAINWAKLGFIVASWVVSPIVGGAVAYSAYTLVRRTIIDRPEPGIEAAKKGPILVAVLVFVLALVTLFKGLKNVKMKLTWVHSLSIAGGAAVLAGLIAKAMGGRREIEPSAAGMERSFIPLQIATACAVAFAHGANDVANAVGPLAAVFATVRDGVVSQKVGVPIWILLMGGTGIVVGLATYGYRVMATIGTKITELSPSRGFAAEFGAAVTILGGSKLGLPLSTTHTLVGAVIGVGFARGLSALDTRVIGKIAMSWFITMPVAALGVIPLYYLLRLFA